MIDVKIGHVGDCDEHLAGEKITLGRQIESLDLPDEVRAVLHDVLEPHWEDSGCAVAVMEMRVHDLDAAPQEDDGRAGKPPRDEPRPCATRDLGARGERVAARYMTECGYRVLERNWRSGYGEADLVCERDGEVVFVEVKTRSGMSALPEEGVDERKVRRYRSIAGDYMRRHPEFDAARFDVLAVNVGEQDEVQIHHFVSVCSWEA